MSEIVLLAFLVFVSSAFGGEAWLSPSRDIAPRPNSIPGVAFPSDATLEAHGWLKVSVPDCDAKYWLRDGDTFAEMSQEEKDAVDAAEAQAAEAAEAARQMAKPMALKRAENNFFALCFALFGDMEKRGFAAITDKLDAMKATDAQTAIVLSIQLLGIDAEAKREGGLAWWDDATYHEEVAQ